MDIAIYQHDLFDICKEKPMKSEGIGRLNPCSSGVTRPWALLERIGLSSVSINNDYTDKFPLYIRRGGILNLNMLGKIHIIMEQEAEMVPDEIRFRLPKHKGQNLADIKQARKVEAIKNSAWHAKEIKTLFKTTILPSIMNFAPECGDTFKLHLHYANRKLRKISLIYGGPEK